MKVKDYAETDPMHGGASFSLGSKLYRIAWSITWLVLASWTPPPLKPWRQFLLRAFGAKVGRDSDVRGSARVWAPVNLIMEDYVLIAERVRCYNQARITLKYRALISQGAYLCCGGHDVHSPSFQLIAKDIVVGEWAWVASEAFVAGGVTIGRRAVLGARAVAFKDLADNGIYVGNPAQFMKWRRGDDTQPSDVPVTADRLHERQS